MPDLILAYFRKQVFPVRQHGVNMSIKACIALVERTWQSIEVRGRGRKGYMKSPCVQSLQEECNNRVVSVIGSDRA
ncbi:MAG TPA: hypothetical protein DEB70_08635 [Planctomycetaceae bacterium]|nr:hypothetical protein [Planctomycetaceae bacterium]